MKANQNLHFEKKQNGDVDDESVGDRSLYTSNINGKEHLQKTDNSTFFKYEYSDLKDQTLKSLTKRAKKINNILSTKHYEDEANEAVDKLAMEIFNKEVKYSIKV
jgi:hypothetical protein